MRWSRIIFEHAKTHFVPTSLRDAVIADIKARGVDVAKSPPQEPEWSLKDGIKSFGIDYGGSRFIKEPWQHLSLAGVDVHFPCFEFGSILGALRQAELRHELGVPTYKLHGAMHCIVMLPQQRVALIRAMEQNLEAAEQSYDAFITEVRRKQGRHPRCRASKAALSMIQPKEES